MAETVDKDPETMRTREERVEIDTTAPFESVKDAVSRFGQLGFWKKPSLLKDPPQQDDNQEEIDVVKLKEEMMEMEKEVDSRERETLDVLQELGAVKKAVEELKFRIQNEENWFVEYQDTNHGLGFSRETQALDREIAFRELNEAKLNLSKATDGLQRIRSYIEILNEKLDEERTSLEEMKKKKHKVGNVDAEVGVEGAVFRESENVAGGDELLLVEDDNKAEKMDGAEQPQEGPKISAADVSVMVGKEGKKSDKGSGDDEKAGVLKANIVECHPNPTMTIGEILSRKLYVPELKEIRLLERQGIIGQNVSLGQMLKGQTLQSTRRKRKSGGFGGFSVLKCKPQKRKKTALDLR